MCLVSLEQIDPPIEHGMRNAKTETELFNGSMMHQVFGNDPEDKKETIGGIGNDKVRKDSM